MKTHFLYIKGKITLPANMTSKGKNYTLTKIPATSPPPPYLKQRQRNPPPANTGGDEPPPLPPMRRPKLANDTQNVPVPKRDAAPALPNRPLPPVPEAEIMATNGSDLKESDAPPLPSRNKASWTQPNNAFEQRFKFHRPNEFPIPNPVLIAKKIYVSQRKKGSPRQKPPPPPTTNM